MHGRPTPPKARRRLLHQQNIYGQFAEHLGCLIYGGLRVGEDSPIPNTRGPRNAVRPAQFSGYRPQGSQLTLSIPPKSVVVSELR